MDSLDPLGLPDQLDQGVQLVKREAREHLGLME
jgi:hypothetical protein